MRVTRRQRRLNLQRARHRLSLVLWCVAILAGVNVRVVHAVPTTRYVAKTGNDANAGTLAAPFLTIKKGAQSSTTPDDELDVETGNYNECLTDTDFTSGTAGHPITFKNYNGETVWMTPTCGTAIGFVNAKAYLVFDGISVDMAGVNSESGIYVGYGAHHLTFQNLTVENTKNNSLGGAGIEMACSNGDAHDNSFINLDIIDNGSRTASGAVNQQHGIYITDGCSNYLVEHSRFHGNGGCGLTVYSFTDKNNNGIVRFNVSHDNVQNPNWGCSQLDVGSGDNAQIYNNIVYQGTCHGTSCMGITVSYTGSNHPKIYNNTVFGFTGATGSYIGIGIGSGVTNAEVKNNAVYGGTPEYSNLGSSTVCDFNSFGDTNPIGCTNSLASTNPLFKNGAVADFTLQALSPLINAGTDLSGSVTTDFNGSSRPMGGRFDIGAFEYGESADGPLAIVSETHGGSTANASTVASTAITHTAGNTLVCGFTWASGVTFVKIENTAGDAWRLASPEIVAGAGDTQRVMYAYNIIGNASDVVTVTLSGSTTYRSLTCKEFHGIDYNAGDPLITSTSAEGTGSALSTTGTVSIGGNADALLFGYMTANGLTGSIVGGAGFATNNYAIAGDARLYYADIYQHVTANTAATATAANATSWYISAVMFKSFPTGSTTTAVHSGDDLQTTFDDAHCGDTIVLDKAVTWTGNFTITKTCTVDAPLLVTSSGTLPASNVRVSCVNDLAQLGTMATSNTGSAMRVGFASDYIYFTGVRFYTSYANIVAGNTTFNIVAYGVDGFGNDATSVGQLPNHIVMDRVCVSGNDNGNVRRGVLMNAQDFTFKYSDVRAIHEVGNQSNALAAYNGTGPFHILKNRIEGASQNILIGGNDSPITNLIGSDGTVTGNLFTKPLEWKYSCVLGTETGCNGHFYAGTRWGIANIFELKCAQRWDIYGNIFENSWPDVQAGTAIVFTPRNQSGGNTWCKVDDVQFRSNLIRNVGQGWSVLGTDDTHTSGLASNIRIRNNLWEDVHVDTIAALSLESNGFFGAITHGSTNLEVSHNTAPVHGRSWIVMTETPEVSTGLILKDNLSTHVYGLTGAATPGTVTLAAFTSGGYTFLNNLLAGIVEDGNTLGQYPATTLTSTYAALAAAFTNAAGHDYRLLSSGPGYRGASDATDVGYNPCDGVFPDPAGDGLTALVCSAPVVTSPVGGRLRLAH